MLNIYQLVETPPNVTSKRCEPCMHRGREISASHFCHDCEERYCVNCMQKHAKSKQTKDHNVVDISFESANCSSCEICEAAAATLYCEDCEDPELLCDICADDHKSLKQNRTHKFSNDIAKFISK